MDTKTDLDTAVLEFMLEQTVYSSREDIHLMCQYTGDDLHVICGVKDSGDIVPEWVEINCAKCLEIEKVALRGDWAKCLGCGEYFTYEDED